MYLSLSLLLQLWDLDELVSFSESDLLQLRKRNK